MTLIVLGLVLAGAPAEAQSITAGALHGSVRAAGGEPLAKAAITIEDHTGASIRELETDDDGGFALRMMLPGAYNVLAEVVGYQPVRLRGVLIASGRTTSVAVVLELRPPPIVAVTEVLQTGATAGPLGRVVQERELRSMGYRADATDLSRGISGVAAPVDGRFGFAQMALGLPGRLSRVFADGVPETLLRHPGSPAEPSIAAAIPRDAVTQGQVSGSALDAEWRGTAGSVLSLITRSATNRFEFAPYAAFSASRLGGNQALNPADSSGTSMWLGASVGGPIKRDTARFFLQGSYQSLQTPSPFPWAQDEASFQGSPVSLRETVPAVANDRYGTALSGGVAPVVRTWKGGAGFGRADWQVGRNSQLMVRAGGAAFKETSPLLGADVGNDAGASLSGRDISVAVAFTSMGTIANEVRIGGSLTRRDWNAAALPATRLVSEGIRFGGNTLLPGLFETRMLSIADAVQYERGNHALKAGVSLDLHSYSQEYDFAAAGQFLFGDLDHFNSGTGVFLRAASTQKEARVSAPLVGVFVQDVWRISPGVDFVVGLRYQTQVLPQNKIVPNPEWRTWTGIVNDSTPKDRRGIEPRFGFVFDPGNRGEWTLQGGVGLFASGMDLAHLAEVIQNSGSNVTVTRVVGNVGSWPGNPAASPGPERSTRLTMFGGGRYRDPRSLKGDFAITRAFRGGTTIQLFASYDHTDYLLRRSDANLAPSPSGAAQDGRPVWGTLQQQGGLVVGVPGSSRRFHDFDVVTIFSPTGFSDHYAATLAINRPVGGSLSLAAEYTYSRTRDNLVGMREPDPADQLSPFPDGVGGADWDEGKSDLDIPHRAAVMFELRTRGITLAARGRWRSGLPFTPGFRGGVDVNGDLGGNNDPAPADAVTSPSGPGVIASCDRTSVAGFAARNSCREKAVGSLDLRLGIPLPVGRQATGRLMLTLDAFNVVASTTGVVDRAALLINPAGALTINSGTGTVTIPYAANLKFGTLLRRGGEPRIVRLGVRMEY